MTPDQQHKFAAFIREHCQHPSPLYMLTFREIAQQALGLPEPPDWRELSDSDARTVMRWVKNYDHNKKTATDIRVSVAVTSSEVIHQDDTTPTDLFGNPQQSAGKRKRGRRKNP